MSRSFTGAVGAPGTTDKISVAAAASINNLPKQTMMMWLNAGVNSHGSIGGHAGLSTWGRDSTQGQSASRLFALPQYITNIAYNTVDAATENIGDVTPIGTWAHVAWTQDDTGDKLVRQFINGVEMTPATGWPYGTHSSPVGAFRDDSGSPLLIGANPTPTTIPCWDGLIFDFRYYNAILSAAQIAQIYSGGSSFDPLPANNKCHLVFSANNGATEPDASGNGNVGVITGTTFSGSNPGPFSTIYSVPDCRNYGQFPNDSVTVQGTVTYTVPAHPSHAAPVDSRTAGAPVDSRNTGLTPTQIPANCRNINAYVH